MEPLRESTCLNNKWRKTEKIIKEAKFKTRRKKTSLTLTTQMSWLRRA